MPHPPKLIDLIAGLVALPSVSSVNPDFDQGNRPVIERLAGWLEDLGYRVEIQDLPGLPGKANLVATLGRGPGGLVLAGHTDTVPWDEGRWSQDPFRLQERDQRLYGLGTADMKAFLALAIEAARGFDARQFREPLILVATADEESSMAGARALVENRNPQARHAVIGEPTGLVPVRLHKGILMESVRVRGRSGHSSDPALGNNALEGMHRVMSELLRWRAELQAKNRNPLFEVPVPTLNLGHIHGGDNPNRICAECELHIDLRPLPGMEPAELRRQMQQRLERALAGTGLELECRPLFEGAPPMETPAGSAIVRTAETLTGYPARAAAWATEAPYFNRMGIETVVLGPGDIAQAHQPDEYLALERIPPMLEILRGLIRRCCLQPPPAHGAPAGKPLT